MSNQWTEKGKAGGDEVLDHGVVAFFRLEEPPIGGVLEINVLIVEV